MSTGSRFGGRFSTNGGREAYMRIFMLGWEYPPFIAGGLGTAVQGLTKSLSRLGHEVVFVLPHSVGEASSEHVRLLGPDSLLEQIRRKEKIIVRRPLAAGPGGGPGRTELPPTSENHAAGGSAAIGAGGGGWIPPTPEEAPPPVGHPAKRPRGEGEASGPDEGTREEAGAGRVEFYEVPVERRSAYPSVALMRELQWILRRAAEAPPPALVSYSERLRAEAASILREPKPARPPPVEAPAEPGVAEGAAPPIGFTASPTPPTPSTPSAPPRLEPSLGQRASEAGDGGEEVEEEVVTITAEELLPLVPDLEAMAAGEHGYGGDLMRDIQRYGTLAVGLARSQSFDVIHAHDWLAYPAGLALKAATGKPLVVHVHATEFDRSGEHVNQAVYEIERAGMHGADRVVCVSELTKRIAISRYGAPEEKVHVVYNGVEQEGAQPRPAQRIHREDKIVLFLGRITSQKGPEYFIRAAKRVLEKYPNVKFVVAGSGDMAVRMIEQAKGLGIGHKVLFTGFLKGRDVARVFRLADLYVMPSVSEPFGIAPLEAMAHDTPVIISKQSGVSEVLQHALKVDFWDIDEMANKIVAVLKYPPLSQTLREHGPFEIRRLTWDGAAEKTVEVYEMAMGLWSEPKPAGGATPGEATPAR